MKLTKLFFLFASSAFMVACGGGGGGSTPQATVFPSQPTTTESTATTTTTPIIPANPVSAPVVVTPTPTIPTETTGTLVTTTPTPTYTQGSVELSIFNKLNAIRVAGNFGALAQDPLWDLAASNHTKYVNANWYVKNSNGFFKWDPLTTAMDPVYNTINAHIEKTGNPGFTGQFPLDRIKYVGASSNGIGEVMQFGFPTNVNCVEVLLNTVFHREHVLGASLNTVGIALQNTFDNIYYSCAIYAGIKGTAQIRPTNWIGIYPGANQTNVPVNMITGEAPDPVPSIANADKGSPISIHFDQNITSISSFTVTEYGSSTSLPSVILGNKDFPQYISGSEAFMITKQAFKAKTTYNVAFTGFLKDGRAVTKGWSFTTV